MRPIRIHQTLKVSPAMAAGVTDRLWEMGDLVEDEQPIRPEKVDRAHLTKQSGKTRLVLNRLGYILRD